MDMAENKNQATKSASPPAAEQAEAGTIQGAWEGFQSILSRLADTLNQLKTVKVTTLAADLQLLTTTDKKSKENIVTGVQPLADPTVNKAEGYVTEIDMLEGDIRHFRSKGMQPPLEGQLKEIHAKHVELAQKIFHDNLRFVADTVHRFWQSE
jgi:hypothetical protein